MVFTIRTTSGFFKEIIERAETQTTIAKCNNSYNCKKLDGDEYICMYNDGKDNIIEIKCDETYIGPSNFNTEETKDENSLESGTTTDDDFDNPPTIEDGFNK